MYRLYLKIPMPKPKDIIEVAKTNISTSRGFADLPKIRLAITAIKVIRPMHISIIPNAIIPKPCFNCINFQQILTGGADEI